jgi:hypothetical protein
MIENDLYKNIRDDITRVNSNINVEDAMNDIIQVDYDYSIESKLKEIVDKKSMKGDINNISRYQPFILKPRRRSIYVNIVFCN